jgi:general secretion pathway protein L
MIHDGLVRLLFLPREGEAFRAWLVRDGRVLDRHAPVDGVDLPTIAVAPGEDVLCRWLDLPEGRDAQVAAAAGFLIEDELAQPRETLHVALGPRATGGKRLAVFVDREQMRAWAESLGGVPRIDALVPDCLLAPQPDGDGPRAIRLGDVWLVRKPERALTVELDLLSLVIPDDAERTDAQADVEALVARGAEAPLFDLRQGVFAPASGRSSAPIRTPILLAGLLALSILAVPAAQATRHAFAADRATAELKRLSGVSDGPEAVSRLQAKLDRMRATERFPAEASAIFTAIERIEGMELQSLLYDEQGVFHLSAAHANYSDVEVLRSGVADAGLAVQELSAAPADGRILSDLLLRPAK